MYLQYPRLVLRPLLLCLHIFALSSLISLWNFIVILSVLLRLQQWLTFDAQVRLGVVLSCVSEVYVSFYIRHTF